MSKGPRPSSPVFNVQTQSACCVDACKACICNWHALTSLLELLCRERRGWISCKCCFAIIPCQRPLQAGSANHACDTPSLEPRQHMPAEAQLAATLPKAYGKVSSECMKFALSVRNVCSHQRGSGLLSSVSQNGFGMPCRNWSKSRQQASAHSLQSPKGALDSHSGLLRGCRPDAAPHRASLKMMWRSF